MTVLALGVVAVQLLRLPRLTYCMWLSRLCV
jgi:hypothetical protein